MVSLKMHSQKINYFLAFFGFYIEGGWGEEIHFVF